MSAPFNAGEWVQQSLRGGMQWAMLDGDYRAKALDPIPSKTWKRLWRAFFAHESEIAAAMRALVGPGDWYLRSMGNIPIPPEDGDLLRYMVGGCRKDTVGLEPNAERVP
jgi:hypothetical protein